MWSIQRDPKVFLLAKWFLGAWGTEAKKLHILRKTMVLLALPPKAASPKKHALLEK